MKARLTAPNSFHKRLISVLGFEYPPSAKAGKSGIAKAREGGAGGRKSVFESGGK
jgi:hypothetical protein